MFRLIPLLFLLLAQITHPEPIKDAQMYMPLAVRDVSSGVATVTGRLVIDGVYPVYLAEVFREEDRAVFVLDLAWSPSVLPEEDGYFIFEGIEPAEYVIVVGNPAHGRSWVIIEEDGAAMVLDVIKGVVLDVGEIVIESLPEEGVR